METGFLELSSLLTVAASLDDEIREVCRARDSERFLKLVADYQSRIYALHHGEFLIFGGGTRVAGCLATLACLDSRTVFVRETRDFPRSPHRRTTLT